jgi:hypothetical protein
VVSAGIDARSSYCVNRACGLHFIRRMGAEVNIFHDIMLLTGNRLRTQSLFFVPVWWFLIVSLLPAYSSGRWQGQEETGAFGI